MAQKSQGLSLNEMAYHSTGIRHHISVQTVQLKDVESSCFRQCHPRHLDVKENLDEPHTAAPPVKSPANTSLSEDEICTTSSLALNSHHENTANHHTVPPT